MKSALQILMPDIEHVENWEIGYILERNKKYAIETNGELQDAWEELKKGFPMLLDPSPDKQRQRSAVERTLNVRNIFDSLYNGI